MYYKRENKYWILTGVVTFAVIVQWFLFRSFVLREISWAYPACHDQTTYLNSAYTTFEQCLGNGILSLILAPWAGHFTYAPNGILMQYVEAPLMFVFFGASRLVALSLNFLHFFCFQSLFVLALYRRVRSAGVVLLGYGVLLMLHTPFMHVGGLADFRLDFSAFCLFGSFVSIVVCSKNFLLRSWSIIAGIVASALILTRFITGVYIFGIYGVVFLFNLAGYYKSKNNGYFCEKILKKRLINILYSCVCVILLIVVPLLYVHKSVLHYYCGMDLSPWRNNSYSLVQELFYYPMMLVHENVGVDTMWILGGVLFAGGIAFVAGRGGGRKRLRAWLFSAELLFLLISFLIPLVILTFQGKTLHVSSILVPSCIWILILLFYSLCGKESGAQRVLLNVLGVIVLSCGLVCQASQYSERINSQHRLELYETEKLYEAVFEYSSSVDWTAPAVSVNSLQDYLVAPIESMIYEKHKVIISPQVRLGHPYAVDLTNAVGLLSSSDIVILTYTNKIGEAVYPFNVSIDKIRPDIERYVQDNFYKQASFTIFGRSTDLFVRPSFRIKGLTADGWIMDDGVVLEIPFAEMPADAELVLRGEDGCDYLPEDWSVDAFVLGCGGEHGKSLLADVIVEDTGYSITIRFPENVHACEKNRNTIRVKLLFDSFFVPAENGWGTDTRRLVMKEPTEKMIIY